MVSDIAKIAAERARDHAETFFDLGRFEMAIKSLMAARELNSELAGLDSYYTAYMVHGLMEKKKTWYEILGINDPEIEFSIIKKEYKKLALVLHPDKNPSKAAEGAFKIVKSGFDLLSNPDKREAYDTGLKKRARAQSTNTTAPATAPTPKRQEQSSSYKRTLIIQTTRGKKTFIIRETSGNVCREYVAPVVNGYIRLY
ncbi:hypothetical protein ACFE04_007707 [Oxalis oulophora]